MFRINEYIEVSNMCPKYKMWEEILGRVENKKIKKIKFDRKIPERVWIYQMRLHLSILELKAKIDI